MFMLNACLYYTVLPVLCSIVITCWGRADLLALSGCFLCPWLGKALECMNL